MRWDIPCLLLASTWIRVASPSIEIYTDSGESTARAVLHRFETLRRIFEGPRVEDPAPPVRVFIFDLQRDYLDYEIDRNAAAFYQSSNGRDLIVALADTALRNIASHEYLHMVMQHASLPLPEWLGEGLAEFYSTVSIHGAKMHIGEAIPRHLSTLAAKRWLSAEDLASGNRADGPLFYAESWALVHMLSLAPAWKDGMPKFVKLLNDGMDQDEAFKTAFGKTMEDALKALRPYLRDPRLITTAAPSIGPPEPIQVTRLPDLDTTLALADLALNTLHPALARSLFLHAARKNPESPAAIAGLATLALIENRKDDARRQFEHAIAIGDRDPDTCFQLAQLTNDNALLEQALSLDPNFAPAHFLLGVRLTDARNFAAAIDHLEKAVAIEPRRFSYWHALAYAQSKAGDRQATAESARRAALLASTGPEKQMAAALTGLAFETPFVQEKKPAATTPASWQNPKGDRRAEGILTRVDCDSKPVRLLLETGTPATTIELIVENPSAVELRNVEGFSTTLDCGNQSRPIAAEYFGATMAVTRIEFKGVIIKR